MGRARRRQRDGRTERRRVRLDRRSRRWPDVRVERSVGFDVRGHSDPVSASEATPPGSSPADIHVGERSVRPRGSVDADAASEIRMTTLHSLGRREDHLRIAMVDPTIAIEVVYPAVTVVVDEDVGGVAVLMPAVLRPTTAPYPTLVVLRSAEATHHRHSADGNAFTLHLGNHELQLVDELFAENEVL